MRKVKNIIGMAFLPVMTFLVFFIITRFTGNTSFGDLYTWRMIFIGTATTVSMGYVLALNMKSGRMDLSCGANMIASSIIAVNLSVKLGLGGWAMMAICIVVCTGFSLITALIYVYTKMPIIVTTIGMALVYEAVTRLVNGGNGANVISTGAYNFWGMAPWAYILMVICIATYHIVTKYTIIGYEANALANNQQLAVNLGINERKNVILIFLVSGMLLGLCSAIYAGTNVISAQSNLVSVGQVFINLLPVLIGFSLAKFGWDSIGILMGALSVGIIKYGLNLLSLGSALNIVLGLFMIAFCAYDMLDARMQRKRQLTASAP